MFAVRIVKRDKYAGVEREFGNTYHYATTLGETFDDSNVATAITAAEKNVTQVSVDFVRWESWGPTDGSAFDNVMRVRGTLSGTGAGADMPRMYREVAAVVAWELPRSPSTNRRRWCRKFIRCVGVAAITVTDPVMAGQDALPSNFITPLTTYGTAVQSVTSGGNTYELCTQEGVTVFPGPLVRQYLVTRDIGK